MRSEGYSSRSVCTCTCLSCVYVCVCVCVSTTILGLQATMRPTHDHVASLCSLCILAFSLVFTPYLSNAVVSAKSPHYFLAVVALKLLVSLISRLVACSARIVADKQTDRQTDR